MLCRLLEPTSGRITVAGVDLAHIDPTTWRARIGVAGQDIDLVEGSVAENIAYGAPARLSRILSGQPGYPMQTHS